MASQPECAPGSPGASGEPIKQAEADETAVPADWLEAEQLELADQFDRLAADAELVTTLALGSYTGPEWDYFATELAKYGLAVIGGWMRRGTIFQRCKLRGYGGLPELGRSFDNDEVDELTGETVSKALVHFRDDVLLKRKWDHRKGACVPSSSVSA